MWEVYDEFEYIDTGLLLMSILVTLLLAIGLAFDALAVSVSCGLSARHVRISDALVVGGFFGLFQSVMPVIGWAIGSVFGNTLTGIDHWVAFVLLGSIGVHMIYEAARPEREPQGVSVLHLRILFLLSVATSIDALVAGFSFAFLRVEVMRTVAIIGFVTFILSVVGYFIGENLGHFFRNKVRFLGGIILICIGVKVLVEHLL
jgi:putative Mn2+ efflux pump MntP